MTSDEKRNLIRSLCAQIGAHGEANDFEPDTYEEADTIGYVTERATLSTRTGFITLSINTRKPVKEPTHD